jgi:sarcosine oxidase
MDADVVVVGLGAFGSAALWRLAARGVRVVGVERHGIGHEHGSSHGRTRLFRIACMEHPGLAPIARKSLALWESLRAETGETLVRQTGCLSIGAPDSRPVLGALGAGEPVESWSHAELVARMPRCAGLGADDVAVWDPGAGICYPERNVRAHVAAAQRLGATVLAGTEISRISVSDKEIVVHTPSGAIQARQAVVAAGAWLGTLVPGLPLTPRPTPICWFTPAEEPDSFALERFPAFIWHRPDGIGLWGHGASEDFGVKVGLGRATTGDDVGELAAVLPHAFPALHPHPTTVIPCVVTDSPDGQFLVGRTHPNLLIAGGDSGHGFKHSAGLGELLAQLTLGETPYCRTDFMDPTRFPSA